jgi:hypothetical protein
MNMAITLVQASQIVNKNLELWEEMWDERCKVYEENKKGTYNKNIFYLIPDLIEELRYNQDHFKNNEYGKRYFSYHLKKYYIDKNKKGEMTISQSIAIKIQRELQFIIEALNSNQSDINNFHIENILPCLVKVEQLLQSEESIKTIVLLLKNILCAEKKIDGSDQNIIELYDFIIILFLKKGMHLGAIKELPNQILDELREYDNEKIICRYIGRPHQNQLSNEEYKKILKDFMAQVSLDDRFNELIKHYSVQSKDCHVIFKVDGFYNGTTGFSVGDVVVYDPKVNSRNVSEEEELWTLKATKIEEIVDDQLCVDVRVKGNDSQSMELMARRKAERALGLIYGRRLNTEQLKLSSEYVICNNNGRVIASGSSKFKLGVFHHKHLYEFTKVPYERFGAWIQNESNNYSIQTWLTSMDWHRKAIECEQSSELLLNAWFSIEHLFSIESRLPLRLPQYFRKRSNESKEYTNWDKKRIAYIQLLLSINAVKNEINNYAASVASIFIPSNKTSFKLRYGQEYILPSELMGKFVNDNGSYNCGKFVDIADKVIEEMETHKLYNLKSEIEKIYLTFNNRNASIKKIEEKIWRVKDDIYNIYRIRNMLVHRAVTDTFLLEYYAKRSLEYSSILLDRLKWNMLKTKDDSGIRDVNEYFQEWIFEANVGLEALQEGDMDGFRKWIFSWP